jgi:hydrogenase expression/formation protein HypC
MCLGVPGQIVEVVDPGLGLAKVDIGGVRREVSTVLVGGEDGGVAPGDWVLIHVGFALARIDEEEARATLALLEQAGAAWEEELAQLREGTP